MRQAVDHFELNSLSFATSGVALFQRLEGATRGLDTELLICISLHDKQSWENLPLGDFMGLVFHIVAAGGFPRSVVPLELTFERALPVFRRSALRSSARPRSPPP